MWGPISRQIISANQATLAVDYRRGDTVDFSGLGRTGTFPAGLVTFGRAGASFSGIGSITHPHHASGLNTTGSLIVLGTFSTRPSAARLVSCGPEITLRYTFYTSAVGAMIYYATASCQSVGNNYLNGTSCHGVNYSSGGKADFYTGGAFQSQSVATATIAGADCRMIIGNHSGGTGTLLSCAVAAVLETNVQLTAVQHAQIFAEMFAQKAPTRPRRVIKQNRTVLSGREANLIASFDMTNAQGVVFDKTGGRNGVATGTTKSIGPGGMPALYFNGTSDKIVTTTNYVAGARTFSWWSKSSLTTINRVFGNSTEDKFAFSFNFDGARPVFYANGTTGSFRYWVDVPAQKDGYWHHWVLATGGGNADASLYCDGVLQTVSATSATNPGAISGSLYIGATATAATYFTGSLCDVRVYGTAFTQEQVDTLRSTYKPLLVSSSDFGSPVSTAARGGVVGDELENTGWRFGSTVPRYSVVSDATTVIDGRACKAMRCSTAGVLYQSTAVLGQTPQEAAYGEWNFSVMKGAGVNASEHISWGNQPTVHTDVGFNGYVISWMYPPNFNWFVFQSVTAGVVTPIRYSYTLGGITMPAVGTFAQFKVMRYANNYWDVWVKSAQYPNWSKMGQVPGGPNYTSFQCMALNLTAGDQVSLGDVSGANSITKSILP
jgi:hypothetical protein